MASDKFKKVEKSCTIADGAPVRTTMETKPIMFRITPDNERAVERLTFVTRAKLSSVINQALEIGLPELLRRHADDFRREAEALRSIVEHPPESEGFAAETPNSTAHSPASDIADRATRASLRKVRSGSTATV